MCGACTTTSPGPSRTASGSRSRTTRAPTAPPTWRRGSTRAFPRCAPSAWSRRAAGGRCEPSGRHSDAPVLAYMDVDLSTDLNALLPLVAPLISGHSDLAIGSRLARSSRVVRGRQAGVHLAGVQPDPARLARRAVLRRAVRVQGDTGRCRAAAAADGRGHRVVLRHRDAGARRARRAADPRGAGGLGRRPGQHRAHREDGDGGPQGRVAGGAGAGGGRAAAGPAVAAVRRRPAGPRGSRGVPGGLARQLVGFCVVGRSVHALLSSPVLPLRAPPRVPNSPTPPPCWSPRSPTPPPTGGSPSGYGAGTARYATRPRAWSSSPSASR